MSGEASTSNSSGMADRIRQTIDNNVEIERNNQEITVEAIENRPKSTTLQYEGRQAEWIQFCKDKNYTDGDMVTPGKLALFVRQHVVPRGRKNQKDKNGNPIPYGKESVDAYVKAVVNLYNIQVSIGNNSHPHPRNKVLRDFLNTLSIKEVKRKRDQYEDRGAHTLTDGYNLREHQSICFRLLSNSFLDCRTRVDWLVGHSTISRGESKRMIQLPDLFMLELEREGPSLCNALVITMNHGKMNQHGKIEYGSFIRHVDVNVCPFGAVALYFFTRFHLEKEAFPDFTTRESWYDIHLLKGKDRKTRMSYDTQNRHFKAVLGEELVEATKTTHINRLSSVRWMDEEDVSNDQQRRAGRWNCDRMVGSYLNTLPKQSMRALAGFYSKTAGNFYLARATIEPPEDLQKLIFPEIEHWLDAFAQKKVQKDIAGPNFLNLLKYLRVVLLQDSVFLKYAKPALLIWQHEIFRSDFYKAFEERLLQIPIEQHMPLGQEIERVLPQLTHVMSSGFNFFGTQIRTIQNDISTINTNMKSINDTIVQSSERQTSQLTYNFRQCLGGILLNSARELLSSSSESPSQDILQNEVPPIPSQVTSTQGNQLPEAESPLALLPPPNAAPSFRQPVAAGASSVMTSIPCVPYKLNRSFHSVVDVWSEYVDGYAGYPPVEKLEELYQTGWRKNPNDSRYFLRRKVIYDEIKNIASQNNSNTMDQNRKLKQAAADLEAYRVEKGLKLDKLMKEITSRNKDKNN